MNYQHDELCPCWECRWPYEMWDLHRAWRAEQQMYALRLIQQVVDVEDYPDAQDMLNQTRSLRGWELFNHHGTTRIGYSDHIRAWELLESSEVDDRPDHAIPEIREIQQHLRKYNEYVKKHELGPYNAHLMNRERGGPRKRMLELIRT